MINLSLISYILTIYYLIIVTTNWFNYLMKDDIQSVNSGISHEDVHSYCNCTISHDRCKTDQMISVSQSICNPFCKRLLKILFNVYIYIYVYSTNG